MKRLMVLALLGVLCLTGCNSAVTDGELEPPHIDDVVESEQDDTQETTQDETMEIDYEEVDMTFDNVKNSVEVADMIAIAIPDKNIMFSPTSLNFALGMVGEGANGESKDLLSKYLGSDHYGDFVQQYMAGLGAYNVENDEDIHGYQTKLEIANALWVDDERTLKKDFQTIVSEKYKATAETLDFDLPADACEIINNWANEKTYGMIPKIVDINAVNEDTEMVLTNSVYFESAWRKPWNFIDQEDAFTLSNGTDESAQYMYREGDAYFENDKATAFSAGYISGLEFIGILPKNTGEFTLESLDIPSLIASRNYEYDELNCKMPRLTFDTEANLTNILSAMGMGQLFTDDATIFDITDEPLKISQIIQKTRLELDENGTKAAAVTAISMNCLTAMRPEKEPVIKEVYLDRPFAFLIYDSDNEEILFIGKVNTTKGN